MDVLYINLYSWPILAANDPGIGLDSWALYSTGHISPIGEQEPDDTPADLLPKLLLTALLSFRRHFHPVTRDVSYLFLQPPSMHP